MPAANTQRIGGHQPLDVDFLFLDGGTALALLGLVGFQCAHQPRHAVDLLDPVVAWALWHVGAESDGAARDLPPGELDRRRPHGHDRLVVAIEQHHTLLAEDAGLGRGIGRHVAVPIQMVLREISEDSDVPFEPTRAVLRERMRGNFHRGSPTTRVNDLRQQLLQIE